MKTSDFYYNLPHELIAQTPSQVRSESRLLVYNRMDDSVKDDYFYNIGDYLNPGDVLVRNTTRVIPARVFGKREDTGGRVEFLLLQCLNGKLWKCLTKPAKRAKKGMTYIVNEQLKIHVVDEADLDGGKIIELEYSGSFEDVINRAGEMPLPPYINEKLEDASRYQTVYANQLGSAAAPTAGLHFTEELLEQIKNKGVKIANILLHVGIGTFRPVMTENVEDHTMHSEYYEVSQEAADIINYAKENGGRVVSVGTTSTRTLESVADEKGYISAKSGWTNIFITPGYRFKVVDAQITNFHLPESTLLMLVSAYSTREKMLRVYQHAVAEKYRFFSFGDAMLIE